MMLHGKGTLFQKPGSDVSDDLAFSALGNPFLCHRFVNSSICRSDRLNWARHRRESRRSAKRCFMKIWTVDVDREKDERLFRLEAQLQSAVDLQNFDKAKSMRDAITRLQSGAFADVIQAHMKFYKAFDECSICDMARVWLQDSATTCKHPVGAMLSGYMEILNSFGFLFSSEIPQITPRNVRFAMRGSVAFVTCDEIIEPRESSRALQSENADYSFSTPEDSQSSTMTCINIFTKKNGEYLLTHHSSSYRGSLDE